MPSMASTGLTNGDYYTVYTGGEHYGFADFEYTDGTDVKTQTYLTLGHTYYVEVPMRAASCFAAAIFLLLLSLLLVVAACYLTRRSRWNAGG